MASRAKQAEPRPRPRLYLVTPPIEDAAFFAPLLEAALGQGDIAAVLLRLAPADERSLINRVKTLSRVVQNEGAALVLDGHADLAARASADGAHLTGIDAFMGAVESLKPDRISGVGGLVTRHDAMLAAEAGADYVMFGEPDAAGTGISFDAIEERVAWWAEVFESPCVAYAASLDEIAPLVRAGADFVALGDFIWGDTSEIGSLVKTALQRLALTEAAK